MVILLPLFSALLTLGLAGYAWRLRHRYAWVFSFAMLMLLVAEWSLGYAFELGASELSAKVFWAKAEYLGIVSVPLLWFVFAWQYVDRHKWLIRSRLLGLSVVPMATFLLVLTNEFHGLIWQETAVAQVGSVSILDVVYGSWFWVHSAYSYLMLLVGSVILLQAFGRFSSVYRWQIAVLFLGPLAPWISNILYISGLSLVPALDMTPLAFAVSGAIFAWGIFRLHLFDLVPVARRTLIDSMSDGMLVVDGQNRIVDVNPAFLAIVELSRTAVIGQSVQMFLVDRPDFVQQYQSSEQHIVQTYEDLELNDRFYDISISPLFNGQEQVHGRLIVLRDITGRKEIEKQLFAQKQLSEIMVSVAWAATQELDLNAAMSNVVQTAVSLTHAETGNLILLDERQQIIHSILVHKGEEAIHQKEDVLQHVMDDGLAGWIMQRREAVLIGDTDEDDRWLQLPDRPNKTRSVLALPVMERSVVIGVLTMTHPAPYHFTDQHKIFLHTAASQMSLALRNAQSYDSQRRLAHNQSTLYQVLRVMSGSLEREDVLVNAADAITELTPWTTICILMVDEMGGEFVSRVRTGALRELTDEYFTVSRGIWGRTLLLDKVQVVPEIRRDPDFVGGYAALQSALAIPMSRGGRQLGVFYLESEHIGGLNDDDRWLADSLAEAISLSVDNAQTHNALRTYASDLSTLYSITRLVSRSLVDEDVLVQALYVALTALRFDMGLIALTDLEGALYLAAQRGAVESVSLQVQEHGFAGTLFDFVYQQQESIYLADLFGQSEELVLVERVLPTAVTHLKQLNIHAAYGVPLLHQDRLLGVLCLFAGEPREEIPLQERALYEAIGHQISTAVTNMSLYSQTSQQLKEQTALRKAITAITSSLELPTVLAQIAQQMSQALDCTSAYICSYEPQKLISQVLAEYISSDANELEKISDLGAVYQLDQEFDYDLVALAKGEPTVVHDNGADLSALDRKHMVQYGAKSILVLPLRVGGQTIAYAELWESRHYRNFTQEETELGQIMAGQAAIAMENANLFASIADERGRLDTLIQSSRDGIVLIGLDGRVLVINERALEFFKLGGLPKEWVNQPIANALMVLEQDVPQVVAVTIAEMRRIEQGDEPVGSGEYEAYSRIIHWQNLPVMSDNTPIGRLLVLRDVTQERLLERMRDDLTSTMVHDLRNPLSSISLSLDIFEQQFGYTEDTKEGRILSRARNSAERMLTLVNDILDISRLESGRMPIESEPVVLSELVANSCQMQMALASQKQIELIHSIAEDIVVWADNRLMERVLQNLVGNALKFTDDEGVVRITAEERETDRGLRVFVSVQDSGGGIPMEIRERLFQKFTTGSQQARGSGLGLAFCRMVLEAHGEQIWVARSSDKGTTFTFTLPLLPVILSENGDNEEAILV